MRALDKIHDSIGSQATISSRRIDLSAGTLEYKTPAATARRLCSYTA